MGIVSPELAETIDYPEIIKFNSFEQIYENFNLKNAKKNS